MSSGSAQRTKKKKQSPFPRSFPELEAWAEEVRRRKLTLAQSEAAAASFRWSRSSRVLGRLEVLVPLERCSDDQRQRLRKLADEYYCYMEETVCGVALDPGMLELHEVRALMRQGLDAKIREIVPGAAPEFVYDIAKGTLGKALDAARKGSRYAERDIAYEFRNGLILEFGGPAGHRGFNDRVRAIARVRVHLARTHPSEDELTADPLRMYYLELLANEGFAGLHKGRGREEIMPILFFALGIRRTIRSLPQSFTR